MSEKTAEKTIHFGCSTKMNEKIEELAEKEKRTKANFCRLLCSKGISELEEKEKC